MGVPRQTLAYLVKKGILERIYPKAYRFSQYEPEFEFQWENLGLVTSSIPNGVICLISALCYYDLTDQVENVENLPTLIAQSIATINDWLRLNTRLIWQRKVSTMNSM